MKADEGVKLTLATFNTLNLSYVAAIVIKTIIGFLILIQISPEALQRVDCLTSALVSQI